MLKYILAIFDQYYIRSTFCEIVYVYNLKLKLGKSKQKCKILEFSSSIANISNYIL